MITIDPEYRLSIEKLLNAPKVSSIAISSNGDISAISFSKKISSGEGYDSWLELRLKQGNKLLQTFRGALKIENLQWAPTGKQLAYTSTDKEKTTLWIADLNNHQIKIISIN